jgi:membrane protein
MALMLAFLKVPLSWREILRRTFSEAFFKDNCLGMAAQLAYYFLFALFPTLLVIMAVADIFAADVIQMVRGAGGLVPREGIDLVTEQVGRLSDSQEGGLLTLGMLTALWSSSAAMTAIIDTLNTAYDIEESRPWWKVRVTAILLTVGLSIFIVAAFALVVAGPTLAERLADRLYLGPVFEWTWKIAQWPVVFALVSGAIAIIYYFAPDAEQDWVWLTPGSLAATAMWLLASLGFKYYLANVGGYESYGVIGGVMVLMLWFYISGLVILLGAEMNAEIEHASPYGKDEGEKVPGEKRKIGPALKRAWEYRHRHHHRRAAAPPAEPASTVQPAAAATTETPLPLPRPATAFSREGGGWSAWVIGAPVVLAQALWALRSYRRHTKS